MSQEIEIAHDDDIVRPVESAALQIVPDAGHFHRPAKGVVGIKATFEVSIDNRRILRRVGDIDNNGRSSTGDIVGTGGRKNAGRGRVQKRVS